MQVDHYLHRGARQSWRDTQSWWRECVGVLGGSPDGQNVNRLWQDGGMFGAVGQNSPRGDSAITTEQAKLAGTLPAQWGNKGGVGTMVRLTE